MDNNFYAQVREFRQKLDLPVNDKPQLLDPHSTSFYARFVMEELSEWLKAHEKQDLVDSADALGDLIYVICGIAHHQGFDLPQILQFIHEANMKKVPGTTRRGHSQDASKPEGWQGPEGNISLHLFGCMR
jgi:predicted HAD superfamily Cof-like phosphohydrolase